MSLEVAGAILGILVGLVTLITVVWRFATLLAKTDVTLNELMKKVVRLERLEEKLVIVAALDLRVGALERAGDDREMRLRNLEAHKK